MKTQIILSAVVIITLVLFADIKIQAQGRRQGPDRVEELKKELSLSDKQIEKVKDIFAKSREEMMNARDENMGDPDAMRKAFKENTDKTNKQIEKILTPEQNKKFTVLKEQWRKQMEERMKNMRQRNN